MDRKYFLISLLVIISPFSAGKPKGAVKKILEADKLFSISIYKELSRQTNDTFMVSPFSIETILTLLQVGAKGETRNEISAALHLPQYQETINAVFRSLTESLRGTKYYQLHTASKIYFGNGFPLNKYFNNIASEIYNFKSESVDFDNPVEAAKIINKWVQEQTHGNIKLFIDWKIIQPLTEAIFLNIIHFRGDFAVPFNRAQTNKSTFYGLKGHAKVETMSNVGHYRYYENLYGDFKMLKLDFKGKKASLVIALPNKKVQLAEIENNLDNVFANDDFNYESIKVQLPKFRIKSNFFINKILQNLGIKTAFERGADFSKIGSKKGRIHIHDIMQEMEVTERGIDALHVSPEILPAGNASKKEFVVDRPFVFYLKIKNTVIFAGRFTDP